MGTVTAPVLVSHSSPICAAWVAMFMSASKMKNPLPGCGRGLFQGSLFLISRNLAVPQELAPSPCGGLPRRHRACPSVALDKKLLLFNCDPARNLTGMVINN